MENSDDIYSIKKILESIDKDNRDRVLDYIDGLRRKIDKDKFLIERNKRNTKVNENFITKTVEKLEISNQQLQDSNLNLKHSNLALERSNEELERFAYIASHDLKTPLNNILSFAHLLQKELKDNQSPKIHQYLSFIKDGSLRMNSLIKSVLEFSKVSKVEEDKVKISFDAIVQEVQLTISNFISQKNGQVIIVNPLPTIFYYHSEILKLFQNLIENGIKYNESPEPTVKIFSQKENGLITLCFEDNGIGIDQEYHERVTKMFTRLHRESEYQGSGLGLAICQKIINRLNGSLEIQSDGNSGTQFILKFMTPSEILD